MRLRRETVSESYIERLERAELAIEPGFRTWTKTVGPTQSCTQVAHSEIFQTSYG